MLCMLTGADQLDRHPKATTMDTQRRTSEVVHYPDPSLRKQGINTPFFRDKTVKKPILSIIARRVLSSRHSLPCETFKKAGPPNPSNSVIPSI
jgi:hypothetical protein